MFQVKVRLGTGVRTARVYRPPSDGRLSQPALLNGAEHDIIVSEGTKPGSGRCLSGSTG